MVTFSMYPADPRPRRAADALLKEGMIIDMICLEDEGSLRRESHGGINVLRLPIRHRRGGKFSYVLNYSAFISICLVVLALRSLRTRYDLVWVHNMPDILVACSLVPKALGAKVILDLHDPMPELMMTIFDLEAGSYSVRLMQKLEKWSIARADLVLTVNAACRRLFASRGGGANKIRVVMNSPDEAIFSRHGSQIRKAASQSSAKRFVIMYHGSLVERNGLDLAINALAKVRDKFRDLEFRVYGRSTQFLEQVMSDARQKGLGDCVRYLGPRSLEDLVREIEDCDLGIIPNHRSAFSEINTPTRIFEYLALRKPVIAPRTPGITDYFGHESLFYFEPGDSDELANQIDTVMSNRRHAAECAERGHQVYLAHTWSQERQNLICLVSQLLMVDKAN